MGHIVIVNTKFLTPRLGALAGLIGSIEFTVFWVLAATADGGWQLGRMTLSELGDRTPGGALLFNSGTVIAGVLAFLFAIGLYRTLSTTPLGRMGSGLLAIASVLLIGVGLFPIHTGLPHTFFSYAFFIVAVISLATLVVPIWRSHVFHASGGMVSALLLVIGLIGAAGLSTAGAEALAVGCLLLWMGLMSIRMLWHHPV